MLAQPVAELELVERLGDRLSGNSLELLPQADDGLALLVRRRPELGGLGLEPGLHLGDRGAVSLPEVRQLGFEVVLRPIEVLREGMQAVLEPALGA